MAPDTLPPPNPLPTLPDTPPTPTLWQRWFGGKQSPQPETDDWSALFGQLFPVKPSYRPPSQHRIYFSISSEGFGHSSRALAMARHLNEGNILIGSYHYALNRVEAFGYPVVAVPQEYELIGDAGKVDISKTLVKNHNRPLQLNQIVQREMETMQQYGISMVVADGRIAPVLAASRLKLPCVVITNQSAFYPFFEQDSPLVQLFGRSFERVMQWWLSSAEEIVIPDFPPPYTVCLPNLSDDPQVKKRTRFVGPMVGFDPDAVVPVNRADFGWDDDKPLIVLSLGGHSYRKPLFDAMLTVAASQSEWNVIILTDFEMPKSAKDLPNVHRCPPPKDAAAYFKAADIVVTQGGHSTAMELLSLGKPSVVVPDAQQIEQENNARRLEGLGVSRCVPHGADLPQRLALALSAVFHSPDVWHNARHMGKLAAQYPGAQQAAKLLTEYSQRLLAY